MSGEPQRVCLLLADLSGYTAYLAASEPSRAPALAADLVETVVRRLRPTFRLEKLEGDAAFMVAPLDGLTGDRLIEAIDATTAAFQTRVRSLERATACTCEACRRIPDLDLKFVVHVGDVIEQRIAGRSELAGVDAILAHRLLKADSPSALGLARYALFTDACVTALGLDARSLPLTPSTERFDYLGDIRVHLLDLAARTAATDHRWSPPKSTPILETELHVPLAPMDLWEALTSPHERARWEGLLQIEERTGEGQRGLGTITACTADRLATVEQIVEWRPFSVFTRTVELPARARLTARHELEPRSDGTTLRVRWWGTRTASAHASRHSERLRQLVT